MRIVSLLPIATEMICAVGLGQRLVGVTHECDFPPRVRGLPAVTRTLLPSDASSGEIDSLVRERRNVSGALYTLDLPVLRSLRPDLIVTQALCRVCAVAEDEVQAAARELPGHPEVLNLEPETLDAVLDAVLDVGRATRADREAEELVGRLRWRVERVAARSAEIRDRPRVVLLEWLDPPFSCGHWSPELVRLAGGVEQVGREGDRSRAVSWGEVVGARPDAVVVACCGFDLERTLRDLPRLRSAPGWSATPAARSGNVHVVDGSQYFSRPGPRLVDSLEILAHALHPEIHPLPRHLLPAARPWRVPLREEEARPPVARPEALGLCGTCRFHRPITSDRGSRFALCLRSRDDPSFPRYPPLPVRICSGFVGEAR